MLNTQTAKMTHRIDDRGFTFVELLIVIAIFSIGILAVASMQVTSINANSSARMSGETTTLAANQLEALMASGYTAEPLDPGSHTLVQGAYTINWVVTESDIDSDGTNESKTVLVTVRCANPNAKDVNMEYIIHEL
jgi:type IV pilus assembly protein PilV